MAEKEKTSSPAAATSNLHAKEDNNKLGEFLYADENSSLRSHNERVMKK